MTGLPRACDALVTQKKEISTLKIKKFAKTAAISSVLLLALSACGSDSEATNTTPDTQDQTSDSDSGAATYTVGGTTTAEPAQEVRIDVSDDLIEADQYYADHRALDAITIRAADVPDAQCGVEYEFEYATGAVEELEKHDNQRIHIAEESEKDKRGNGIPNTAVIGLKTQPEDSKYHRATGTATQDNFEDRGFTDQDFTQYIDKVDCATNPSDPDAIESVKFRSFEWKEANDIWLSGAFGGINSEAIPEYDGAKGLTNDTFAEVEYTVMANGDIQIISAEIEGWTQDSNGMWLED